jgi:hypothetical protein
LLAVGGVGDVAGVASGLGAAVFWATIDALEGGALGGAALALLAFADPLPLITGQP